MVVSSQPKNWQHTVGLVAILVGVLLSAVVSNGRVEKSHRNLTPGGSPSTGNSAPPGSTAPSANTTKSTPLTGPAVDPWAVQAAAVPMQGSGITIELTDSARRPGPGEDPHFFIVHDVDLQALVNELWASDCEAVSINEQRIALRTPIRCVGPTILVNTSRIGGPYVIKALGPPAALESAVCINGGFTNSLYMFVRSGGKIKITRSSKLLVPAFHGSRPFAYATPVL